MERAILFKVLVIIAVLAVHIEAAGHEQNGGSRPSRPRPSRTSRPSSNLQRRCVKHDTAIDSLLHIIKDVRVPIEAKIGVVITISSLASEVRSMMNQDFCEPFHEICSEILKRQDYAEISAALSLLELMIKTDAKFMITFRDFLEPLANENDVVNRATYLLRYMNNE